MADLDKTKLYLMRHKPHWHGGMLDLRAKLFAMQVGESFVSKTPKVHAYDAAKDVGVKISYKKLDKGGWEIKKLSHSTDSLEDLIFQEISELAEDVDPEKIRLIGFSLTKRIQEYYAKDI